MSARVSSSPLKCSATGDSSVLLCAMLKRWLFTLRCSGCPVSPTYCWPHLLQVIRWIILEYLHEAAKFIYIPGQLYGWWIHPRPAILDTSYIQAAPQGWLPGGSRLLAVRVIRTKKSLKFFAWRKAINGWSGNASHSRSKVWRVERWRLVIDWKFGRIGWYVTTSGIWADLSWLGHDCKQFSFKIASARWIYYLIAALDTPALSDVFEFAGPLLKMFLRENSLEAKRLAIRVWYFAMVWVAAIHSEVLVHVRGLDMQVNTNLAVFQGDPRIKEGTFFCWPQSDKFDGWMVTVEVFNENSYSGSPWSHMTKMSSIYLLQMRGILSWACRNSCLRFPMNKVTYDGTIRVPVAVPWSYK